MNQLSRRRLIFNNNNMSETMGDMLSEVAERQRLHNSREVDNIAMSPETAKKTLEKIEEGEISGLSQKTIDMIKDRANEVLNDK